MKALISPNEKSYDFNTGEELGLRVADVHPNGFDVASPMFWVECNMSVVADFYYYDEAKSAIVQKPFFVEPVPLNTNQPIVDGAQSL